MDSGEIKANEMFLSLLCILYWGQLIYFSLFFQTGNKVASSEENPSYIIFGKSELGKFFHLDSETLFQGY